MKADHPGESGACFGVDEEDSAGVGSRMMTSKPGALATRQLDAQ
jgi:hypothetical protein